MDNVQSEISKLERFSGYKLRDAELLYSYLQREADKHLSVDEIMVNYGGDPLRIYSLIDEFSKNGLLEITQKGFWGEATGCVGRRVSDNPFLSHTDMK